MHTLGAAKELLQRSLFIYRGRQMPRSELSFTRRRASFEEEPGAGFRNKTKDSGSLSDLPYADVVSSCSLGVFTTTGVVSFPGSRLPLARDADSLAFVKEGAAISLEPRTGVALALLYTQQPHPNILQLFAAPENPRCSGVSNRNRL